MVTTQLSSLLVGIPMANLAQDTTGDDNLSIVRFSGSTKKVRLDKIN